MSTSWKPNPAVAASFKKTFSEYAKIMKKDNAKGIPKLMHKCAKNFTIAVADVTPPAQVRKPNPDILGDKGATGADSTAKKRGEQAIIGDVLKLCVPVQGLTKREVEDTLNTAEELAEAYARSVSQGRRVNPRNRREKLRVSRGVYRAFISPRLKMVGFLAAGLNAAAGKLGFKLPAWIARHGAKFGSVSIQFTATRFTIRICQNVPYADNIKDYTRAWDYALKAVQGGLIREIEGMGKRLAEEGKARLK